MKSTTDIEKIQSVLKDVVAGSKSEFLSGLLTAYNFPKPTIIKLKQHGPDSDGYYSVKQRLLYRELNAGEDVESALFKAVSDCKHKERFAVVTDFNKIMAKDNRYDTILDVDFQYLPDHYDFFFPWVGREQIEEVVENPADVKAATQMGHLFELIMKDNPGFPEKPMNVFLTRLLFCFFADDSNIFKDNQFRDYFNKWTNPDGSDVDTRLTLLFDMLNMKYEDRAYKDVPEYDFPYVNGGLFAEHYQIPKFSKVSRQKLLDCAHSDWSGISPDIFGSMFQTVISEDQRRSLGQHYTSVPNIMKVLNPLFLDDLRAELESISKIDNPKTRDKKADEFINRISKIKVFDPACGSGNFLIIAYKELCRLEMEAIKLKDVMPLEGLHIHLDNFYGIEIDDFPCEIARLSLWLAQHQMNLECYLNYGVTNPTLPLQASGKIICGNALRIKWEDVCPISDNDEVYLCGNPPYAGGGNQVISPEMRKDMYFVYNNKLPHGKIDYITCWFYIGAQYISKSPKAFLAFVTTNSICQGVQTVFWDKVFSLNIEIFFAYDSFKWRNNASHNAGVTVSIIGLRNKDKKTCTFYCKDKSITCSAIDSRLKPTSGEVVEIIGSSFPPEGIAPLLLGSMFKDGGNLILTVAEKDELLEKYPTSDQFLHKFIGSAEFINGKERWCLWIPDHLYSEADKIPAIHERIEAVRQFRLESKADSTRRKAETPWKPIQIGFKPNKSFILVPAISSENREYVPIGYLNPNIVVNNKAFVIYDGDLWLFALLNSKMHMVWMRTVCGRMRTDYSYSSTLCYNTFPFPKLSDEQKKKLEESALAILKCREADHFGETLASLYDPDKMPDDLRAAHTANDLLVDSLYRSTGFSNDNDRLQELFRRYKAATSKDNLIK